MIDKNETAVHSSQYSIVEELPNEIEPFDALRRLSHLPFPVLLDSSLTHTDLGTVSYVAADPFEFELAHSASVSTLSKIDELQKQFRIESIIGLPQFQGGLVGLFSYELNGCFEDMPTTVNEFGIPNLFFGLYDTLLIFDHESGRNWIVSHGFPELEPHSRKNRAEQRAKQFLNLISGDIPDKGTRTEISKSALAKPLDKSRILGIQQSNISNRLFSNFTRQQYIDAVRKCIEYIYSGDIFQVNLSQRLLCTQTDTPLDIYKNLRQKNQATFSAFLDLGEVQILSSSPERLLKIDTDGELETRPIKGTRQRSCYPEANLFAAEGLIASEKDRSENVMIVDLLRNDLSKICEDDSIHVSKLCGIENYEFVQHLVSVIKGQLKTNTEFSQILEAVFPGGSITGAPKVRAMEIISELERVARGAYCGSLGYIGFDGSVDLNILIRTMTLSRGWLQIPVGGGIVSQSDPVSEYEETVHKAHGMLAALF